MTAHDEAAHRLDAAVSAVGRHRAPLRLVGEGAEPSPAAVTDWQEECRHLRQAQVVADVGSWRYDCASATISVSHGMAAIIRLTQPRVGLDAEILFRHVHPDDEPGLREVLNQALTVGASFRIRYRMASGNAPVTWIDARGEAEYDRAGQPASVCGAIADVTELVEAEQQAVQARDALVQSSNFQQAVITATPDAIHIYDVVTARLRRANLSGLPLIGYTDEIAEVLLGQQTARLVPGVDRVRLHRTFRSAQDVPDGQVVQVRHRVLHGEAVRWVSRRMTPFARTSDGAMSRILVVSRDVTDVAELEEQLEHAAQHDELTGLANRRLIKQCVVGALRNLARGHHVAVLICGDEFALLLDIAPDEDPYIVATQVAERIDQATAEPIPVEGTHHLVTASIGMQVVSPSSADAAGSHPPTAEALFGEADAAMYHVKSHGGNRYSLFEAAHHRDRAGRDEVERLIRRALADDLVEVFYQPIVEPRTAAMRAVEALVRVRDDAGHLLDSATVVDVAESTGLVAALDAHVLRTACRQVVTWRALPGCGDLTLKVNRSVHDITKPGFADRILAALEETGLPAAALTLEITETVLLHATPANLEDVRQLAAGGIGLAIDDFGTGFVSMRYLAELPVTCIKIDRSFTNRLPDDPTAMTLVQATVGLAEQFGLDCVVEGVETLQQLASLPDYERLNVQGYLFGRAQSAADLFHWAPIRPAVPSASGDRRRS